MSRDDKDRSAELNEIVRVAAVKVCKTGSIDDLATLAKVSGESIRSSIRNGRFSVGLASALELAAGREYIQREVLCPKLAEKGSQDVQEQQGENN